MLDFFRRPPSRLDVFAGNVRITLPSLTGFADPDRVAQGVAVAEHVIEVPFVGFHDDGAGRIFVKADAVGTGVAGITGEQGWRKNCSGTTKAECQNNTRQGT